MGFGQVPGPGPGQAPSQPPIRIPHRGGARAERTQPETPTGGPVYVVLSFDVQDYILPQSDEAAKRLAVFLTQEEVPATFKIVGEKARVLQQRQRQDVITAIAQHEIGYNSNTHSQHPTVAEYEADLGWDAGVEEFTRRERPGFDDVARIFRKTPVAYGQPGLSWAPQAFPALQKWGVRLYLGEGKQVGLRGRPFWYAGMLNIFNTHEGEELLPNPEWSNLDMAKARFQETYLTLSSRKNGGLVSVNFSPCEFVNLAPWNEMNFREGGNPPRDQWRSPPLRTPERTEEAFRYFEGLVHFLKSFPRVQFLTASQAAARYRDRARMHIFTTQEVAAIAGQVDPEVTFLEQDNFDLSASEVFYILNKFLVGIVGKRSSESLILNETPYGPTAAAEPLKAKLVIPAADIRNALMEVQDILDKQNQIPNTIRINGQYVPPESYLVGIAQAVRSLIRQAEMPDDVTFVPARLAAADYVADDSPDLWDWPIFPRGFHAPKLMSLAKLQAWTLKPVR